MAIKKLDRSFAPTNRQLNYLSKTFPQWRQSFIDYAKVYFPNSYSDFNESSPGMLFIELASYLGDVLGFYIDNQFKENLIQYTQDPENIISIAQSLGFKPRPSTAASVQLDVYQLCPATDITQNYIPDSRYFLHFSGDAVVLSTTAGNVPFRISQEVNFADPTARELTVYSVDINNRPTMYLVRKTVTAVAGSINTYTAVFNAPQKFTKIVLPDDNVLGVLSVKDSNGFSWYEVDYLGQDLVLDNQQNLFPVTSSTQSIFPTYLLNIRREPRRFITRYSSDFKLELHFGSGLVSDTNANINLQPNQVASSEYQTNLASTPLDPSDFLSSNSYGLAPSNILLTVTYVIGGGLLSNAQSNSINKILNVNILNDPGIFVNPNERALYNNVVRSLAVNNTLPATGGKDQDTVEEIRQNAATFFNAQNRLVTFNDYAVRAMAMSPIYGSPAKVFVVRDEQINNIMRANSQQPTLNGQFVNDPVGKNVVNIYVLGYNQNKRLVTLNDQTKENLRRYLDQYRILTDQIRILDAFVIDIGLTFTVSVFKNFNMNEVLARCIDAMQNFFIIDRWNINQPIILNDIYLELARMDGVQSVVNIQISNKYQFQDGSDYNNYLYDISAATVNGVILNSLDPSIFEIRYPQSDIKGSAIQ
jgi:hypothetical protein